MTLTVVTQRESCVMSESHSLRQTCPGKLVLGQVTFVAVPKRI
jgi:hypothetical protein